MDWLHFYIYLILLHLQIDGLTGKPKLTHTTSGNIVYLECKVSPYDSKFNIGLYITINGKVYRSYENCIQVGNPVVKTINCVNMTENETLLVRYEMDKWSMSSGEYVCRYTGQDSSTYSHTQPIRTITTTFRLPTTSLVPVKESIIQIELVWGLIGLFALSCVLNIAFIIRWCIVKRYLEKYPNVSRRTKVFPKWSWVTCFCLREEIKATDVYYNIQSNRYESIRNKHGSDKSKSSAITNEYHNRPISQDTEKLCFSSTGSQISRSSTFAAGLPFIVHTPIDQYSMSTMAPLPPSEGLPHPFVMSPYGPPDPTQTMKPLINPNHRRSSYYIYDEVPAEHIAINSSTMPIRHFASTGSLQSRPRQLGNLTHNSNFKSSPLPEEDQINFTKFTAKDVAHPEEEMGLIVNDCSSVLQDFSSSEETYLSGKDNDSMKDPVRVAKLEMSREMMAKADTLLREAHNLLKMT